MTLSCIRPQTWQEVWAKLGMNESAALHRPRCDVTKVFCQTLAGREWLCNSTSWQLCLWVPFWDHPPCHPLPQQRSFSYCASFAIHPIEIKFAWVSKNRNIFYFSDKKRLFFAGFSAHYWLWCTREVNLKSMKKTHKIRVARVNSWQQLFFLEYSPDFPSAPQLIDQ